MTPRHAEGGKPYRNAKGLWVVSIELPNPTGRPEDRRRKYVTSKNKTEVLRKRDTIREQLKRAGDIPTASMTVRDWNDYWLREIATKTRRPKTVQSYRSIITNHINPIIGGTRLDKLTPTQIRKVVSVMEEKQSSTYARNAHAVMSASFKDAERDGRLARNPVELVQAPRKAATNLTALTLDDALQLMGTFRDDNPDSYMWATFLLTGARRGEVLGLEWDRVHLDTTPHIDLSWQLQRLQWRHGCGPERAKGKAALCGHKLAGLCPKKKLNLPADHEARHLTNGMYLTRPKSRAGYRIIPLVEPLYGILARWKTQAPDNPWGLLFTRHDGTGDLVPIDPDVVTKMWPAALKAAGIDKDVRVHGLRHTAVDFLYEAGVDEEVISMVVGHSNRAVTRGYKSKQRTDRAVEGMKRLSTLLGFDN